HASTAQRATPTADRPCHGSPSFDRSLLSCPPRLAHRGSSMTDSTVLTDDDGAWTWFNDPRAIFHDGQILTGWVNRRGDIQFASHDLASGRTTVLMLHPAFQADDHDNPALLKN